MDIDEIKEAWNLFRESIKHRHPIEEYNENYDDFDGEEEDHDCQFD